MWQSRPSGLTTKKVFIHYVPLSCSMQNVLIGLALQFDTSSSVYCCSDNGNLWRKKKKKNYRKEGSDETGVCPPPALTTASLFSLLPPNPYSLQCKQKLCHLHTCPAPGAAGRERVHPLSSCTIQGLLPVLILSTECGFTSLLCLFASFSEHCSWHRKTTERKAIR